MKTVARRALVAASLLAAAAALLLAPPGARAQTWRGDELRRLMDEAPWHFGPFLIQPAFVIANAGVDSNIYYTVSNPVKDFTLTAGPAATLYMPIHRRLARPGGPTSRPVSQPSQFVLTLYGSPQYVWYSKTERERTWNYYFRGAAQLDLKNAFFSVEGLYSDARERYSTEIDYRPRRKELGYGASSLLRLAYKTSFALGYRVVKYDYESIDYSGFNLRDRLNRTENYATMSIFYQAAESRRFFLDLEYGRYDFENRTQAALRNSESGAVFSGLEFTQIDGRVRGRIRLGYKKFDPRNPETPKFDGFVGDTQISVRMGLFAVRGSYVRNVQFSIWYGDAYFIETRPGIGLSFYPIFFVRLDYDYGRGQNRYPVSDSGGLTRLDRYNTHTGGLYFRIMRRTALGFVLSWWDRISNIPGENDRRLFYGLNLTYDF
jgi:hypothetical protein